MIPLDADRRDQLMRELQGFFLDQFDEELSPFRAAELLDFILDRVAPPAYNQGVQDARKYMMEKLDDLEGDVRVG